MVALTQNLYAYDNFGLVEAAVTGPLRPSLGYWGDQMLFEPAAFNVITNPSFETNLTGVTAGGTTAPTLTRSTLRCWLGTTSLLVTWPTQTAGSSQVSQTPTVAAGAAQSASCWVWVPVGSPAVTLTATSGTATVSGLTAGTSTVTGKWQRLTCTFTSSAAGTVNIVLTTAAASTSGMYVITDAWQLEQGIVPTTYFDGSLASLWNAAGSMKTWDFEDGTISSFTFANATGASSSAAPYQGTLALRVTATAASATANSPSGTSATAGTAFKTYTAIAWARGSAARNGTLSLNFYNSAGTLLTSSGGSFTLVAGTYIKLVSTAQAPANTAFVGVTFSSSNSVAADTFDLDAIRLEEGTASGAYYWASTEHGSTSFRQATSVQHVLPGALTAANAHSVACRATVAYTRAAARTLFSVGASATNYIRIDLDTSGNITSTSTVAGTPTAGPSVNIGGSVGGDQLLVGYTLSAAGVFTVYASKNGGSFVTANLTNAAYNSSYILGLMWPGSQLAAGQYCSCAIEHLIFYNALLLSTDFDTLRTTSTEPSYVADSRILYAYLTGTYRNMSQALSAAGVGQTRQRVATTCYVENNIAATNLTSDDDASTTKITVPANSGIGLGDTVSLTAGGGTTYTVKQVLALGGAYDELWVA
jgi:hypothetical protein